MTDMQRLGEYDTDSTLIEAANAWCDAWWHGTLSGHGDHGPVLAALSRLEKRSKQLNAILFKLALADGMADDDVAKIHDVNIETLLDRIVAKTLIGRKALELDMADDGEDHATPFWWCGCGDLVDLNDPYWAEHGRCVNCCAAHDLSIDE